MSQTESSLQVPAFPTTGEPVEVQLPPGTTALRATYQPDSPIAEAVVEEVAGDAATWTPVRPGIVQLTALQGQEELASKDVSVTFDGVSVPGLVICLVAMTLLFGGATWSLRLLLRGDD